MWISRYGGKPLKKHGISVHPWLATCRLKSAITIAPANQSSNVKQITTRTSDPPTKYITPPETLITYLNKYTKWFPNDVSTNSQIASFKNLVRGDATSTQAGSIIHIAILYADNHTRMSSRLIESLLADPLSEGNQSWFRPITTRSSTERNHFKFAADATENDGEVKNLYKVNSPILSPTFRPSFVKSSNPTDPSYSNAIELWELNDSSSGVDEYHFVINVVSEIDQILKAQYPTQVQDKILLNVIDNVEYTPLSTESTPVTFDTTNIQRHTIKINSQLVFRGIQKFLELDTKAATEFVDSIHRSNIFELQKAICWYLRSTNLSQWILQEINESIESLHIQPHELENTSKVIKEEHIAQFSHYVHTELQDSLIPETTKFFKKKLSWWKLYYKNDNVEYDLKDFFNRSFMNQSIEKYNYVRGQILAKLKSQDFSEAQEFQSGLNPLLELKNSVINERIVHELQPFVYRILGAAFTIYQLPISVIGFLGYQYFGISLNAAIAIGLLGWVFGFNHVSKSWTQLTSSWLQALFEEVRLTVGKKCIQNGLLQEVTTKYNEELKLSTIRREVLEEIFKASQPKD